MSRTHLVGLVGLLIVTSLIISACTTRDNTGDGVQSTGVMNVGRPAVGGEVVFALPSDPTTLAVFWAKSASDYAVINQVYGDGLMRLGFDHMPEPALAETPPVVSSDGKTYTFKVRQGVEFHDGSPLTAYDFAFSYSVVLSPDYAGVYNGAYSMIESVEAKDDYTLEIVLKAPFAPFLFEGASLPPVPRHIFGSIAVKDLPTAKQWQKPVGAGAFKFVEWKSRQYVLLGRNPEYWERGKQGGANGTLGPWIDTVRMRIIADENARVAALEAGELSFLVAVPPAAVDRLISEYKDRFVRYDWDRPGYGFQTFNTEAFPTNIREVRQALSYGLNREAIRTGILKGRATVPPGFIPAVSWAFDRTLQGYPYDPKRAEQLLVAAGFQKNAGGIYEKGGRPLRIKYLAGKGSPLLEGVAQQAKVDWAAIGIDVVVELTDPTTLMQKSVAAGDFNVAAFDTEFSADPYGSLFAHFHSKRVSIDWTGRNTGSNLSRYRNPDVDELLNMSTRVTDLNGRLKLYQAAQKLIVADAPENWIYSNIYTDVAVKELKGVVNWNGVGIDAPQFMPQWFFHAN